MNLVKAERELTREQEELLEAKGVMFFRGDVLPSRFMTGMTMMRAMDAHNAVLAGRHWGVQRSSGAQFLVPDGPGFLAAVPLSPFTCLLLDARDAAWEAPDVGLLDRGLLANAGDSYFAVALEHCPMRRRTVPWPAESPKARGSVDAGRRVRSR